MEEAQFIAHANVREENFYEKQITAFDNLSIKIIHLQFILISIGIELHDLSSVYEIFSI